MAFCRSGLTYYRANQRFWCQSRCGGAEGLTFLKVMLIKEVFVDSNGN